MVMIYFFFKLVLIYNNLANYTCRTETFFFSYCLVLPEIEVSYVLSILSNEWERLSSGMGQDLSIWGTEKSTQTKPDSRPWAWFSWPWGTCWEINLDSFCRVPPQPVWRNLYSQLTDLFCKQMSLNLAVFGSSEIARVYSCLEKSHGRRSLVAAVYGVAQNRTP